MWYAARIMVKVWVSVTAMLLIPWLLMNLLTGEDCLRETFLSHPAAKLGIGVTACLFLIVLLFNPAGRRDSELELGRRHRRQPY